MAMVVLRRAGVDPPLREAIHAKPKPNEALVVQRAKQRNGTLDPKRAECLAELSKGALARLIGWKLNREHKVRGMTRRGEGACPTERLIYWTRVDAFAWWLTVDHRFEPDGREREKELLWPRFDEDPPVAIPTGALKEEATDATSRFRRIRRIFGIRILYRVRE